MAGKWCGETQVSFVLSMLAHLQELADIWLLTLCKCKWTVWFLKCTSLISWMYQREKPVSLWGVSATPHDVPNVFLLWNEHAWVTGASVSCFSRDAVVINTKRCEKWEGWCFRYLYNFVRNTKYLANMLTVSLSNASSPLRVSSSHHNTFCVQFCFQQVVFFCGQIWSLVLASNGIFQWLNCTTVLLQKCTTYLWLFCSEMWLF